MKVVKSRKAKKYIYLFASMFLATFLTGCSPIKKVGGIIYYEMTGDRKYLNEEEEEEILFRDRLTEEAIINAYDNLGIENEKYVSSLTLYNPYTIDDLLFFENLRTLCINDGYINYTDTFKYLSNLEQLVLRRCNNLIKLDDLKDTNISFLMLDSLNNVEDYSFLNEMSNLKSLDIHSCKNFDIDKLENINIKSLTIENITKDDLTFLYKFPNLESLIITNSSISSLKGVENLPNLKTLYLNDSLLDDISALYKVPSIERLCIINNSVDEIDFSKFPNLKLFNFGLNFKLYNWDVYNYCFEHNIKTDVCEQDIKYMEIIRRNVRDLKLDNLEPAEKLRVIYNYVINHMEYDNDAIEDSNISTIYNVNGLKYAILGKGVCLNYGYLLDAMCDEAGINAYFIRGLGVTESEYGPHGWNLIEIDGKYGLYDPTWSDASDNDGTYYNCTGEDAIKFNQEHIEESYSIDNNVVRVRSLKACEK